MDKRTRLECENWDNDVPVAIKAKERRRMPARKVLTTGIGRVALTKRQMGGITQMLRSGKEVRLSDGADAILRLYPCAETDFRTMFVAAQAVGSFRRAAYEGRKLRFTSAKGSRELSGEDVALRVAKVVAERREGVTPEVLVSCPKCGFEFKVGKSLR